MQKNVEKRRGVRAVPCILLSRLVHGSLRK